MRQRISFAWLLICLCPALQAAQSDLRPRVMEHLEEEEAAKILGNFRTQWLDKNFCFQFQLEHKPRRGRKVRYDGIMYGSWNKGGPVSRVRLFTDELGKDTAATQSPVEIIVQNGMSPKVWIRRQNSQPFVEIGDESMFEPIFDGVVYSPFDLQMPFIFWQKYAYEGPSRVLSRIGQKFLMHAPEGSLADTEGISAVRVSVDDTYYALLRAEVLQGDKKVRSRFTVRGIKKAQDRHIVSKIELKNMLTKDATDFKVKAAGLGMEFDKALFDPEGAEELPGIREMQLEPL